MSESKRPISGQYHRLATPEECAEAARRANAQSPTGHIGAGFGSRAGAPLFVLDGTPPEGAGVFATQHIRPRAPALISGSITSGTVAVGQPSGGATAGDRTFVDLDGALRAHERRVHANYSALSAQLNEVSTQLKRQMTGGAAIHIATVSPSSPSVAAPRAKHPGVTITTPMGKVSFSAAVLVPIGRYLKENSVLRLTAVVCRTVCIPLEALEDTVRGWLKQPRP